MTTDDRDTESANPSKSFKVGEVDRLSGFFTPVWESKRRLRSESPIPSSSAAASAPSSARGASSDKAATSRPSVPPPAPSRPSVPPPAPSRRSNPPANANAARPAASSRPPRPAATMAAERGAEPATLEADASVASKSVIGESAAGTPIAPPTARATGPSSAGAVASERIAADDVAARHPITDGDGVEPEAESADTEAEAEADAVPEPRVAAAAVTVRPVIPMPKTPGRASRSKPPSTPPPAPADGPRKRAASPHGPEALIEREPDFRSPPAARAPVQAALQRSARAAAAATAMHERFIKGRLQSDSVDTFARHRETESEREAAVAAAARAAAAPEDPYSSHVLRSLRRTIHLSTPLPEAVRQMIEKYRY